MMIQGIERNIALPSKKLSFSRDFKTQYYDRDKKTRDEIDTAISLLDGLTHWTRKNELHFSKAKFKIKIKASCETLLVAIVPAPPPSDIKIIIRRLTS